MRPLRFWARTLAWIAFLVVFPVAIGSLAGRIGLLVAVVLDLVAVLGLWLWLPRSAHAMFETGHFGNAVRRYRMIGALTRSLSRERAALLSRIGCHIAAGELDHAESLLASLQRGQLDAQERAVWLNNRACAALARGSDPHAALALSDEASALRPDVPALQHTRGMALLAVGRTDDAIAVLDGMRAAGELSPRLEAERCRELAAAWTAKNEPAYADDYRMRAAALGR
jgi:predicted Zn-dependent protease